MAITSNRSGNHCAIDLSGRFDFSCRGDFRASYVNTPRGSSYIVDFTRVDYIDSAALGMLLMLKEHAGDANLVTLIGCNGQPAQVLKIANFHKIFRFE